MERGTLASGNDLTWILPLWLSCFLSIPLGDSVGACTRLNTRMFELYEWKLFFLSCRQEVRSSCWNGDSPTHQKPLLAHQYWLAPILMKPISGQYGWNTQKWQPDWLQYCPISASLDRQEGITPWCILTQIHTNIDTHLPSFIRNLKECLCCSAVGFQSIWCWSRVPIIFCFFCSRSL